MRHLIQKQEFEITATSLRTGQQWEHRAANILRDVINPAVESCFNRASSPGILHIIDRLEIDLGKLDNNISEEEIRGIVTQELMKTLDNAPSTKEKQDAAYTQQSGDSRKVLSNSEAGIVSFIYFLLHGVLPWWAADKPVSGTWSRQGDSVEWLDKITSQQAAHLKTILHNNEHARQRLASQFKDELLIPVLRLLGLPKQEDVVRTWQWLQAISSIQDRSFHTMRNTYWSYWVAKAAGADEKPYAFLHSLLQLIQQNNNARQEITNLISENNESKITPDLKERLTDTLRLEELTKLAAEEQILKTFSPGENKAFVNNANADNTRHDTTNDIGNNNPLSPEKSTDNTSLEKLLVNTTGIKEMVHKKLQQVTIKEPKSPFKDKPSDISEIFAEDAGLVIVHPFLQELFTSLSLLDQQKQWRSAECQQTGVQLLAWIARGSTDIPEYELIVPKLFCGMPWEEVPDTSIALNEQHIHTATELLQAVITHWQALGKTSPDGLREGFINRQGKLSTRKNGWLITVEKKAQDVLLARLPWGYSMIQFPWFKNCLIHVDWA